MEGDLSLQAIQNMTLETQSCWKTWDRGDYDFVMKPPIAIVVPLCP